MWKMLHIQDTHANSTMFPYLKMERNELCDDFEIWNEKEWKLIVVEIEQKFSDIQERDKHIIILIIQSLE